PSWWRCCSTIPGDAAASSDLIDVDHFLRARGLVRAQAREEASGLVFDENEVAVTYRQKTVCHDSIDVLHERGVEAADVQDSEWLGVQSEHPPGPDLEELLECADAARQCDERVGQ